MDISRTIEVRDLSELVPYDNNPRNNTKSVARVAESIKQFGFKVPIVVDKDNVIICGHTRRLAAIKLGLKEVPVIVAGDLDKRQSDALRLVDNRVSDFSDWTPDRLGLELAKFTDFDLDLSLYDFNSLLGDLTLEPEEKKPEKNQEYQTVNAYNLDDFDKSRAAGRYEMPTLTPVSIQVDRWIGFNYAKSSKDYEAGIHFYLDDYQFERVWNSPEKYIEILARYKAAMTPSFSLYMDMPEPMKIWNTYRSRLLGQMMQDRGLAVVPIVYWADERSFEYCFDGLPKNSILSVYTVGVGDPAVFGVWKKGMDELIRRKSPRQLLLYGNGSVPDYDFGNLDVLPIKNDVIERVRKL